MLVLGIASIGWTFAESRRIEGLRLAAQAKVDEAHAMTEPAELPKANTLLTEALGQVRAEANLAQLRERIQSDLENIARLIAAAERERLVELRGKVARLLDDAKVAGDTNQGYDQANTFLTEAVTLLANEPSLVDLHRQAQSR